MASEGEGRRNQLFSREGQWSGLRNLRRQTGLSQLLLIKSDFSINLLVESLDDQLDLSFQ